MDLSVGTELPELKRTVTQEHINLYAEASRDFNPIHTDPEFARKTPLGGTVAHGMLILAYLSEFMTVNFGQSWLTGGKLNVRFKAPTRPGDTISVSGEITKIEEEDNCTLYYCDVLCQNQNGEPLIIGETKVRVKQ
ncbi:MAG: MaoC family dehydratase [Chloroflexota bacterium]